MNGPLVNAAVSRSGYALAIAIVTAALLRFLKWLLEFTFARLDLGHKRIADRLAHVEQELDAWREFGMVMMHALARIDPDNPALAHAAQLLRKTAPRASMDLDELISRLDAIPGTKEGKDGKAG